MQHQSFNSRVTLGGCLININGSSLSRHLLSNLAWRSEPGKLCGFGKREALSRMAGEERFFLDEGGAVRNLCEQVAELVWKRAAGGALQAFTFVAKDVHESPLAYAPEVPTALTREELAQVQRDYAYVFHVYPARVQPWKPVAHERVEAVDGELRLVVLCAAQAHSWRLLVPLTERGPEFVQADFARCYSVSALDEARFEAVTREPVALPVAEDSPEVFLPPPSPAGSAAGLRAGDEAANQIQWGLRLQPRVYYDFAIHPVAGNLKSLATLRVGRTSPDEVFALVEHSLPALREAALASLFQEFAGQPLGCEENLPELDELVRGGAREVALPLAYWAYSQDVQTEGGVSLAELARKFGLASSLALEAALGRYNGLTAPARCPVCGEAAVYRVSRFAAARRFVSYAFECPSCGHQEAYARDAGWVRATSHCLCPVCTQETERVAAGNVSAVEHALREAVYAAPGMAYDALQGFERFRFPGEPEYRPPRHMTYECNGWAGRTEVRVKLSSLPGKAEPPFYVFGLNWWRTSNDDYDVANVANAYHATGLRVEVCESPLPAARSFAVSVRTASRSVSLFVYESLDLTGRALLNEQLDALDRDGLLATRTEALKRIRLAPAFTLEAISQHRKPLRLPLRERAVNVRCASHEVPYVSTLTRAFSRQFPAREAVEQLIARAFANAADHRTRLLSEVSGIRQNGLPDLLSDLVNKKGVAGRRARKVLDSFSHNLPLQKKVYAALFWNFTGEGLGGPVRETAQQRVDLPYWPDTDWTDSHPLTLATACPRCAHPNAVFQVLGRTHVDTLPWRLVCPACGHETGLTKSGFQVCHCPGCLGAVREALDGLSIADVLTKLAQDIKKLARDITALTEVETAGDVLVAEGEADLPADVAGLETRYRSLVEAGHGWRRLEFADDVALLAWATSERFVEPTLAVLGRMMAERASPPSDAALHTLRAFVERHLGNVKSSDEVAMPLQLVPPDWGLADKDG